MNMRGADIATNKLDRDYIKTLKEQYTNTLKNINRELETVYARYGQDGKLSIEIMSVKDRNRVTRLEKLTNVINEELNSLNRGRPQELAGHLTNVYEVNYNYGAKQIQKFVSTSFDIINRQAVYQSAVSPLGKIALMSNAESVKIGIQRTITQSIIMGDSIKDMAKGIEKVLGTNTNNAVTIARTETTRIMSESREKLFADAIDKGIEVVKEWVSATDDRTRQSHLDMNGKRVEVGKTFSVNGYQMERPCDSSHGAPPSEVVNCRCTITGHLPQYED